MGVAGKGMGAFAGLLKSAGYQVRGSDKGAYPPMSDKLAEWGIDVMTPYAEENLAPTPDMVIVGNVIRRTNVEATAMREQEIPHQSFPETLYEMFLKSRPTFVVAGTHGKTTTSGLLAETLFHLGANPGFIVGGILKAFDESFRLGQHDAPFVVEGDEYDTAYFDKGPKFLHYRPNFLQLTSLEFDHADIYDSIAEIESRFIELVANMSGEDIVMMADLEELDGIAHAHRTAGAQAKMMRYGTKGQADYRCHDATVVDGLTRFSITFEGRTVQVSTPLIGEHNVLNVTGAFGLLRQYGFETDAIVEALSKFQGTGQRMDCLGTSENLKLYDDYAHHPTAVKTTLAGVRSAYPDHHLVALFEAGSATSCRTFFQNEYADSLALADAVYIAPLGRQLPPEESLNVRQLEHDVAQKTSHGAYAFDSHDEMFRAVVEAVESYDGTRPVFVLMMSNGSFGGLRSRLKERLFPEGSC